MLRAAASRCSVCEWLCASRPSTMSAAATRLYKALTHPHAAGPARALIACSGTRRPGRDRRSARRGGRVCRDLRLWPDGGRRGLRAGHRANRRRAARASRPPADRTVGEPGPLRLCRRVRCRAADPAAGAVPAERGDGLQPRRDAPAGGAADQSPRLSRSAEFRDQFRLLPRHRHRCTRASSPRITGPATARARSPAG